MGQDARELVAPDPGNLVLFDRALSEVAPEHDDGLHPGTWVGDPSVQVARGTASATRDGIILVAIVRILVPADNELPRVHADFAGEAFRFEHEHPGWSDENVVDVAVPGVDVVEQHPVALEQRAQRSRRGSLTVCAAAPSLDVPWRGIKQNKSGSYAGTNPNADPELLVAWVGEDRDG